MRAFHNSHPQLIDAPFHPSYTDFVDPYFISQSKFYIGMLSGPLNVAYIFDVPVLLTNVIYMHGLIGYRKRLVLPKKYWSENIIDSLRSMKYCYRPHVILTTLNNSSVREFSCKKTLAKKFLQLFKNWNKYLEEYTQIRLIF